MSAKKAAPKKATKPKSVPMKATPLYELSWHEYAKASEDDWEAIRSQSHLIRIELEPAMSLFAALSVSVDFQDVKIEKSKWQTYSAEPESPRQESPETT